MPWTAEQKREARKKRKLEQDQTDRKFSMQLLTCRPPENKLKTLYKKKDLGKSKVDCGGHQKALNFVMPKDIQQVQMSLQPDIPHSSKADDVHSNPPWLNKNFTTTKQEQ